MDRPLFRKKRTLFAYHRENVLLNWALIGLLIVSGAAFAQGIMGDAQQTMPDYVKLDLDVDGFITLVEARQVPGLPEKFSAVDANGDGKLNAAEYAAFQSLLKGKAPIGG